MSEPNDNLPDVTFEDLGLSEPLLRAVREAGYQHAMPVQAASYQPIREGRNIVVQSRTGSGKTAAFALPVLERLAPEPGLPQVLVLAPTRELALQVHGEFERLGQFMGLRSVCIYGGTRYREQLDALKAGVHVVVGTPGRILDHWRRRTLDLSRTGCLILDEADEMLSAGFYEDIRKVLEALEGLKQVLLFSATLPSNLQNLIRRFMPDPVKVDLSTDRVDVARIDNIAYDIDSAGSRIRALVGVLEAEDPGCAIIFCNMRSTTESVTNYLRRRGYDASLLNSDLSQTKREEVMNAMKSGQKRLLVATDIAARGIDISFLPCVIHYDLPDDPQLYIHRTGRTGRVDRHGRAIALMSLKDKAATQRIEWRYGIKLQKAETPSREETLKMLADRRIREIKERIEAGRVIPEEFTAIAREVLTDPEAEKVVAMLIDSYLAEPVEHETRAEPPQRREYERDVPPVQGEGGERKRPRHRSSGRGRGGAPRS